ncbi:MAG: hypothetical protein AAF633_22870 [Chloroflexota bacterium]
MNHLLRHNIAIISILIFLFGVGCSQADSDEWDQYPHDLDFAVEYWEGSLTYLNYSDDTTEISLPASLKVEKMRADEASANYRITFIYEEPDGSRRRNRFRIETNTTGQTMMVDGEAWQVESRLIEGPAEESENKIVLTRMGSDNNREARLTLTIESDYDTFTMSQAVTYVDDGTTLLRNIHFFDWRTETFFEDEAQ